MTEIKGDLISREWLKDAFDNLCCHNCKICRNFRNEDSFYKCNLIENAPTVERPHGVWIPCSERLPEECVNCLGWIDRECWVDGNDYPTRKQETAIGWHIDGRWHFDGYSSNAKCIAWMPLPEPYKKEGGADNEM